MRPHQSDEPSPAAAGETDRKATKRLVADCMVMAVLALVVRGAICFSSLDSYRADPDAYRAIAETLAKTGVYGLIAPSGETIAIAFRPPLYPWLLSWLVVGGSLSAVAVAAFHTVLGALTVVLTYWTARRLLGESSRPLASVMAALLVLVDPILVQQSTEVMTETLATFLTVVVLCCWARSVGSMTIGGAVMLGVAIAMSYLCRPTFLVWGVLIGAGMMLAKVRGSKDFGWSQLVLVAGLLLVTVGAWSIRNVRSIGHPVWATTHGGYTLLLANNPPFYDYLQNGEWGEVWDSQSFQRAYQFRFDGDPTTAEFWEQDWSGPSAIERGDVEGVTETGDDRIAYEAAKATIARQPGMFVWSCVIRVMRLWSPIPHATEGRSVAVTVVVGCWYVAVYIAVVIGGWRLCRRSARRFWTAWWPVAALLFTLTGVHAVYWSNMRMRAPSIPALAILAAAVIVRNPLEQSDVADH